MARRKKDRLKRAKSKNKPEKKPILLVVTGATEKKYFDDRKKEKRYASLNIKIENTGGDSNPLVILGKYKGFEFFSEIENKSIPFHAIWFHFDYDNETVMGMDKQPHKDDNFDNACDRVLNKDSKWLLNSKRRWCKIVYSNPCFEFWALLHFQYIDSFINRIDSERKLKMHLPDYKKGSKYPLYS